MKYVEVYTDSAEKALKVAQATVDGLNVEVWAYRGWERTGNVAGVFGNARYRWPVEKAEKKESERMICPIGESCLINCIHKKEHNKMFECVTSCCKHQKCIPLSEYKAREKKKAVPEAEPESVPHYRPWKPEEMPGNVWVTHRFGFSWHVPQKVRASGFYCDTDWHTWKSALENLVWSDRPFGEENVCGVEVEAEVEHSSGVIVNSKPYGLMKGSGER